MKTTLQTILPETTLDQAARKMREYNIGLLPVVEEDRVLGVVTDRDIVVRAVAEGRNPRTTKVADVMTTKVIFCCTDQSVADAYRIMEKNRVRRLVVLDPDDYLAGVVTINDLAASTVKQNLSESPMPRVLPFG
jgi:CBS domain-containing protein